MSLCRLIQHPKKKRAPNKVSTVRSQNKADRTAAISHQMPKIKGYPDPKAAILQLNIIYPRVYSK
ncbi:hypothetical protein [Ammoniphilus resinae]|uniref:Uncharacterized protein n=1 Tax=Ammoniphilus resinae TaxID=861532 RepID=A0ABS4GIE7_9BACL|nr:hypothetical protein [Ammoniphilus resinae]MBP1930032.1 hypothetical protein [Ammoniphilus resinae]